MRSEVSLHLKNTSKVYLFVVILKGDLNKIILLQFIYICKFSILTTKDKFNILNTDEKWSFAVFEKRYIVKKHFESLFICGYIKRLILNNAFTIYSCITLKVYLQLSYHHSLPFSRVRFPVKTTRKFETDSII